MPLAVTPVLSSSVHSTSPQCPEKQPIPGRPSILQGIGEGGEVKKGVWCANSV